jgi:valyl-tRNA synthetase
MNSTYDTLNSEKIAQELWESQNTYAASNNTGPLYSIDTPPPTVSGALHIGHIFSYTQTDIIARYTRMRGFSVYYPFGFDDNGLATERFVEKKLNIVAHKLSRSSFIELCLQETAAVEEQFKLLWQKMGLSVDWSQSYSTIGQLSRRTSQKSFLELYHKGLAYRQEQPALYCTTCRTSVAQAELDDAERPSFFNDIIFTTTTGEKLVIGTTRPELLPACVAVFYNPKDLRYVHLSGQQARVPLFDYDVPILADESVLPDKGTGLVMCCTFGDKTDIEWFKKFGLPYRQAIGRDGRFVEHITKELANKKVAEARAYILEQLKENDLLVAQKAITHAVNIHERCKNEIEYLMLPQWFLKVMPFKDKFLELGDYIEWYPAFMKSRYKNWVENISWDWGLSRQRFYGIPFPVWYCAACNEVLTLSEDQLPVDPQETKYPGVCSRCSSSDIVPETDVMDTWNTSSLTPYICKELYEQSTVNPEKFIPMSMRPQAHDIIRTWAFYTIVKSWMHDQTIPWDRIVISGHVLSTDREKISKSQGNSPLVPENLLKLYSADAIRYWTASGGLGHDVAFSEAQIKVGQRLITKLWNAFRFIQEHTQSIASSDLSKFSLESTANQWIIHQLQDSFDRYTSAFEEHEFSGALGAIEQFFWKDFCDNYLEFIKDQLFHPELYPTSEVDATRAVLYIVGLRIVQLYAPFIPHVTETIYQELYKSREQTASLHATKLQDIELPALDKKAVFEMGVLISIVEQVRKLKSTHALSLKTDLVELKVLGKPDLESIILKNILMLKGVTRAQKIVLEKTEQSITASEAQLEQSDSKWYGTVIVQN